MTLVIKALNYFLLLCFCFKNLDWFERQTTQWDFSLSTLFAIFTSCGLKLWVKSLHPKQHLVPSCLPIFIGFVSDTFHFLLFVKMFLSIHFKHFDFIALCFLNSNSSNLFEIQCINDFLVDFLMCLCILFISLKMLKSFSSGLILINTQC